jgi:glycosyltransferase involved in cell wall biosynthesis
MKIGIYQANWGGIGGAELYVASMAEVLGRSYKIEIAHHGESQMSLETLQEVMDVDLSRVSFRRTPKPERLSGGGRNPFVKFAREREWCAELSRPYDLFINSGLIVPCFCHASVGCLLTYFPMETMDEYHGRGTEEWRIRSIANKLASRFYQHMEWRARISSYRQNISISAFTQLWLRRYWGVESEILYPPLRREFGHNEKQRRIISIGRFDPHIKNYIELVRAFIALCDAGLSGWEYVVIGGLNDHGDPAFHQESVDHLEALKSRAAGYPISFLTNLGGEELKHVIETSSLFWHAAGYGVDAERHPGRMEHFGIVTTEAMAAGCVPIVFGGGGQPEIVQNDVNGYIWNQPSDLVKSTLFLIENSEKLNEMSKNARNGARRFSKEAFGARLLEILAPVLQ